MTVTRDFNIGTIVTIALFLVIQSTTAVWWAAKITTELETLNRVTTEAKARTVIRANYVDAEQLRQWGRITSMETTLSRVDILNTVVQDQLSVLRAEVQTNNDLLRELLVALGQSK